MLSITSDKKLGGAGNEAMVLPKLTNEMLEVAKAAHILTRKVICPRSPMSLRCL